MLATQSRIIGTLLAISTVIVSGGAILTCTVVQSALPVAGDDLTGLIGFTGASGPV